jgi:putative FmdB family regulatory protein
MPVYEYRCRTCETTFEARRPMSQAAVPIDCPDGHAETTRLLSVFASVGRGAASPAFEASGARPPGGGCGPACACMS